MSQEETPETRPTKRRGRKSKCTPEATDAVCDAIAANVPLRIAAACAGVSARTLQNWLEWGAEGKHEQYVTFYLAVTKARAKAAKDLMQGITAAGRNPTYWKAAQWVAKTVHGIGAETNHRPDVVVNLVAGVVQTQSNTDDNVIEAEDTPLGIARARVARLRQALAKADADGSHQAFAMLDRQLDTATKELLTLEEEAKAKARDIPEHEYLLRLRNAALTMPEAHLAVFGRAWLERHRLTAVSATERRLPDREAGQRTTDSTG